MMCFAMLCVFAWQAPAATGTIEGNAAAVFAAVPGAWVEIAPGVWEKGTGAQNVRFVSGSAAFEAELEAVSYQIETLRDLLAQATPAFENRELLEAMAKLEARERSLLSVLDHGTQKRLNPKQASVQKTLANLYLNAQAGPQSGTGQVRYQSPYAGSGSIEIKVDSGNGELPEERRGDGNGLSFSRDLSFTSQRCGTDCSSEVRVRVTGKDSNGDDFDITFSDRNTTCGPGNNDGPLQLLYRSGPPLTTPEFRYHFYRIHVSVLGGCGGYTYTWTPSSPGEMVDPISSEVGTVRLPYGASGWVTVVVTDGNNNSGEVEIRLEPDWRGVPLIRPATRQN